MKLLQTSSLGNNWRLKQVQGNLKARCPYWFPNQHGRNTQRKRHISEPSQNNTSSIFAPGSRAMTLTASSTTAAATAVPLQDTVKLLGVTLKSAMMMDQHNMEVICRNAHTSLQLPAYTYMHVHCSVRHIRPLADTRHKQHQLNHKAWLQ